MLPEYGCASGGLWKVTGMPAISKGQKKLISGFVPVLLLTWILGVLPASVIRVGHITTLLYPAIFLVWGLTVRDRVLSPAIRRMLMAGVLFLTLLFFLRLCRWDIFPDSAVGSEYLWYTYYLPFILVPLLSFFISCRIGREERPGLSLSETVLLAAAAFLCISVLTNRFHGFMFRIYAEEGVRLLYDYGPLYDGIVLWCAALTFLSFVILLQRCSVSAAKRAWWVPCISGILGGLLILFYYLAGGAPTLFGRKLYNLQEAYALTFLFFWEGCFQIGLIPTNTDYAELYRAMDLRSAMADTGGKIVFESGEGLPPEADAVIGEAETSAALSKDFILHRSPVSGGTFYWVEDRSAIHRTQDEIKAAIEQLQEGNTLLYYENEWKERQSALATQNRLYDTIASSVMPQAAKIRDRMDQFRRGDIRALQEAMVLAVYVKRRANLTLIAEESPQMALSDLYFSVRESVDYLKLLDVSADVIFCADSIAGAQEHEITRRETRTDGHFGDADVKMPSRMLIAFYDLFESILEMLLPSENPARKEPSAREGVSVHEVSSLLVRIGFGDRISLRMMTDAIPDEGEWEATAGRADASGIRAEYQKEADAVWLRISAPKEGVMP